MQESVMLHIISSRRQLACGYVPAQARLLG